MRQSFLSLWKKPFQFQEKHFESILEILPNAAFLVDLSGRLIISANNKAIMLTAYSRGELSELPLINLFPSPNIETIFTLNPQGETATIELKTRNSSYLDVNVTLQPVDITEQIVILSVELQAVREQLNQQQKIQDDRIYGFGNLLNAFEITDISNNAIEKIINAGKKITNVTTLVYYSKSEDHSGPDLIYNKTFGDDPLEFFPEVYNFETEKTSFSMWSSGKRMVTSLHKLAKLKGIGFVACHSTQNGYLALANDKNNTVGEIEALSKMVAQAISAIELLEEILTNYDRRLFELSSEVHVGETIKNGVYDGVITISPDLTVLSMNPSAELTFGYAAAEADKQPIENIIVGAEDLIPALRQSFEKGRIYDLGTIELHRRNGIPFAAHVRIVPLEDDNGVNKTILLINDNSEQEELRVHTKHLEQQAYLGEIAAIFAHEVRNPINNISTGLQLMGYGFDENDPRQEQIQRMLQDCERLTHLMDSSLSVSRPTEYKMTGIDVEYLIRKVLERWHAKMNNANIQHQLIVSPSTPKVIGNARYLDQVFTNLISNAIDAMEENGGALTINIRLADLKDEKEKVEINISDTGPGIPEELQEKIFKPYYSTRSKGTGLGLAISKRIITSHKGSIHLNSFPGGTIFCVRLPAELK